MTAQKGKDLLLKVDSDGEGSFTTVAGLRARALAFNAATVDITNQESAGRWLAVGRRGAQDRADLGQRHLQGRRLGRDAPPVFLRRPVRDWQVIVPDLGTVEGPFQIATLEYGGQHDGEVTFELGLESAGALSFTAA